MPSTTSKQPYLPFELLIGAQTATGYPVTVLEAPAGDTEGICTLRIDEELQDALRAVEAANIDATFLSEFGTFLFTELFTGTVANLYRVSLGMARSQQKGLRIRLRITPPEVAALPWEYLRDPQEDAFLATSPETALVRYIPISLPVRPTIITPPLRVLIVIANPRDVQPINVAGEKAMLQEALQERVKQGQVQLEILERAVAAEISQALRRFQPHVFHFVGHGLFDQSMAYVVLEDEQGNANPVDERTFREFFSSSQETRLAVLNACQSATLSSSQSLVGLAPRLLQRQLSAVVAMQYPISDKAALVFTREFYRSLALGFPVDAAIAEARKGIFLEIGSGTPAWGTPVLFLRAKDGRLFEVEEPVTKTLEIPAPPKPTQLPEMLSFVGRDAELTYFAEKLETTHLAVIVGMAGVGKTALATKLIEWMARDRDRVFWHSFHEGEGIDVVIWSLAGFLARHGRSDLWQLLQSARLTGGKPPPSETLFDYLLQLIRGGNFIFCFDDFHHVDDDPVLNQLAERLRNALLAGDLSLILTSRRAPDFVTLAEFNPLAGLSAADVRKLLLLRGLALTEVQIDELYQSTAGNAEFLTLAINALLQARDPDILISRLAASDDIERYLLQEVDETLTGQERSVMSAVAILLGYAGTRNAIEMILNGGNTFRILRNLAERHLLIAREGEAGREYLQHAIVRAFYYEQMNLRERRGMHRRAGAYYETEEPDLLRASTHFGRAGEFDHAAALATKDIWAMINQGEVRALRELLEQFTSKQLVLPTGLEVKLALGQIYTLQSANAQAHHCFEEVVTQVEALSHSPMTQLFSARACRGMGELLDREDPQAALDWLQRGLETVPPENMQERAALLISCGTVQMYLSNYPAAEVALETGLGLLASQPTQLHATALLNLNAVLSYQGKFERATACGVRALAISKELHDDFKMAETLGNIGADQFENGDWPAAIHAFEQALSIAERLGYNKFKAFIAANLGIVHLNRGDTLRAEEYFSQSLTLAQKYHDHLMEINLHFNLADLYIRIGEYAKARTLLAEAESLPLMSEERSFLGSLHRGYAEIELADGALQAAQAQINDALQLSEAIGEVADYGVALRVLGQVLWAESNFDSAQTAFQQSLELLNVRYPYEAARTKLQWGKSLLTSPDPNQGRILLNEARIVFEKLGAKQDLALVDSVNKEDVYKDEFYTEK